MEYLSQRCQKVQRHKQTWSTFSLSFTYSSLLYLCVCVVGMSLSIGENHKEEAVHWNHSRRAVLTGDVMTRTGAARADIFLDDNDYA